MDDKPQHGTGTARTTDSIPIPIPTPTPRRCGGLKPTLYSVVQSAGRHRLDPFAYLRDLLARVSTHPDNRIGELFPDRWQQQIHALL